jgi:hypothetical protein
LPSRAAPSQTRVLARATAERPAGDAGGATPTGGGGGAAGGSGGAGGSRGGGDSGADADAAYREVLQHIRAEQEQLGQLIQHPF